MTNAKKNYASYRCHLAQMGIQKLMIEGRQASMVSFSCCSHLHPCAYVHCGCRHLHHGCLDGCSFLSQVA